MDVTNIFFGHVFDPMTLSGKGLALILAVLLGELIGLEREWRGHTAGMRTHILVCLGATVITLTSVEIAMRLPERSRFTGPLSLQALHHVCI